jgi:hypothetical protein
LQKEHDPVLELDALGLLRLELMQRRHRNLLPRFAFLRMGNTTESNNSGNQQKN